MKLRLKFLHEIFYDCQFKKYYCNSTHIYNRTIWVGIYFHASLQFLIVKGLRLSGLGCFSNFLVSFSPIYRIYQSIFDYFNKLIAHWFSSFFKGGQIIDNASEVIFFFLSSHIMVYYLVHSNI